MLVWTVANQKGGVGKTTSSVTLGSIAAVTGQRVLLIDLDPHGSMSSYFQRNPDQPSSSSFNLFETQQTLTLAALMQIIQTTDFDRLHLIPAAVTLATLERQAIGEGLGLALKRALKPLVEHYDLVVIDCPPQLGILLVNALAACDHLIIPVQTEFLAIKGLDRMLNTMSMLGKSRGEGIPHTIVPVMYDRRTQASVVSLRTIRNDYGAQVWPGKIPIDTRLRDASKAGVPPNILSPEARAVLAYQSLYKFIAQQIDDQRDYAS